MRTTFFFGKSILYKENVPPSPSVFQCEEKWAELPVKGFELPFGSLSGVDPLHLTLLIVWVDKKLTHYDLIYMDSE